MGASAGAAGSLGRLAARAGRRGITPAHVQSLVGEALGDSMLTLALRAPGRAGYVDVQGAPLELPSNSERVRVTSIAREGRPVAALIHDAALEADPDLFESLAATSLMLLENTRLVAELRDSRARIAAAAQGERLRVERDLHDGAQQRLMAIQVKLGLARQHTSDDDLAERIEAIRADTADAIEELRALAHGIYPSALRDGGLAEALRSLAMRASIPISLKSEDIGRFPEVVEAAVYFCTLEAVRNATKHAGPGARITITLVRSGSGLEFEIVDDGAGIDPRAPSESLGLVSMHDRVGAVGGELAIRSSAGRGTVVRGSVPGEAPCFGSAAPAREAAASDTKR